MTGERDGKLSGRIEPHIVRILLCRSGDISPSPKKPQEPKWQVVLCISAYASEIDLAACRDDDVVRKANDTALWRVIDCHRMGRGGVIGKVSSIGAGERDRKRSRAGKGEGARTLHSRRGSSSAKVPRKAQGEILLCIDTGPLKGQGRQRG
jgi:hypothetical protein